MKKELCSYPILRMPNPNQQFILYTDASNVGIGAVLGQKDDNGNEYVIAYASRQLHGAEINYGITEKECLAVLWSVRHLRHYLYGTKFQVITDHSALQWLINLKDPNGRLSRWSLYLQQYDMEIIHRPGNIHHNADCLSRQNGNNEVNQQEALSVSLVEKVNGEHYYDNALMEYLKSSKFQSGMTERNKKRIIRASKNLMWKDERICIMRDNAWKIIPKIEEREEIIKSCHEFGHFQVEATCARIEERYYWINLRKQVKEMIKGCEICARNQPTSELRDVLRPLTVNGIFDKVAVDLVFGLPETSEGYCGILVIQDYLSKFPYAIPIKSKRGEEIARGFWEFISIFGPPGEVVSDKGKEFVNWIVESMCETCKITKTLTSAYHPQTNGMVEKFNQVLIRTLRKVAEKEQKHWNLWLPYALLAYRSRVHGVTKYSPYELAFGKKMRWFSDNFPASNHQSDESEIIFKRMQEIGTEIITAREKVRNRIKLEQNKLATQKYRDNRGRLNSLKIGTHVYLKVPPEHGKLDNLYEGPFTIVAKTKFGSYYLMNANGVLHEGSVPIERLKIVRPTSITTENNSLVNAQNTPITNPPAINEDVSEFKGGDVSL